MATHNLTDEDCLEALRLVHEAGGVLSVAAREAKIPRATLEHRVKRAQERGLVYSAPKEAPFELPTLPDDDAPIEDVIELQTRRAVAKMARKHAAKWMPIKVKMPGPIGLMWLGDPHIDDNGCDWPTLRHHLSIIQSSDAIKGCSLGDAQNAWVGGLQRLWAHQDTSSGTAQKLVRWLVDQMDPLILIRGNHDAWLGEGDPLLYCTDRAAVENWRADIALHFANGRECRIVAAHDLPGHSMWNELHGQLRAAKMGVRADLYISGHRHTWGLTHLELPDRDEHPVCWLARARGFKFHDSHAQRLGFPEQNHGQSILQIIDPEAERETGFVQCFSDVDHGADYLSWLREKRGHGKQRRLA